ncbi:hypothetical protein GCM10009533_03310 [Saccharopolyspora spinosporotrichia]|uniref:Uncharacterized protein n=1 Tax=Saccharopolyspora erythraea TaxID=1836 RepID=A0ABN1BY43_SACER
MPGAGGSRVGLATSHLVAPQRAGPVQPLRALEIFLQGRNVEWTRYAQCAWERPTPLGLAKACGVGVQPRSPARKPPPWVRDGGGTRATTLGDHSQQLGGRRPDPTSHTRSHRTEA